MLPDGITLRAWLSTQTTCATAMWHSPRGRFPARHVAIPDLATFDVSGPTLVSCRLMEEKLLTANEAGSLPLWFLTESELPRWLNLQPAPVASWVRAHAF